MLQQIFFQEDGARSVLVSDGEDHEAGLEWVVDQLSKKISVYSLGGTEEGVIPRAGGYVLDKMGSLEEQAYG